MTIGTLIGKGRTADIHAFGDDKVIKLFHEETPESQVDYEFKINLVANQYDCPCPRVYEKVNIDNRFGIVFEKVEGVTVTDLLKKPMSSAKQLAMHTASAHAKINKVSFGSSGHPFDENSIILPRQYDYFKKCINATEVLSDDEKKQIIDYLLKLPDSLRLCHGDLHTDNYIVVGSTHYIIDWTNAYIGHPASDIARSILLMQTPYGKEDIPGILRPFASMIIQSYMSSFLKIYSSITEVKQSEIEAWMLPVAAARLSENVPHEREWLLSIIKEELNKQRYH